MKFSILLTFDKATYESWFILGMPSSSLPALDKWLKLFIEILLLPKSFLEIFGIKLTELSVTGWVKVLYILSFVLLLYWLFWFCADSFIGDKAELHKASLFNSGENALWLFVKL